MGQPVEVTVLTDLQDAAVRSDVTLSEILRRAQLLAGRINNENLGQWARAELEGYRDKAALPDYRCLGRVPVLGDTSGPFQSGMRNAPLNPRAVPEEFRELLFVHYVYEGVAQLEQMRLSDASQYPWPAEIIASLADNFYENQGVITAHKVVSSAALTGVLDSVRSRLLQFVIDLEKLDPSAGELGASGTQASPASIQQVFNTTIYGGKVAFASTAAGDISQSLISTQELSGWEDVASKLTELGLPSDQLAALRKALDEDSSGTEIVVGTHTTGWLGLLSMKIAAGAITMAEGVGVDVVASLLEKLTHL